MAEGDNARLHYFDHLRALAMLAGVLFHAALAYSPLMQPWWPPADRATLPAVDLVAWGLHLVRMPLFFLVAGWFAAHVIARRGGAALARQRLRRIALPFLVAWPLVAWSLSASTGWAAMHVEHPSAVLALVREWMQQPDPPSPPPGTAHLWFLYYLLLLSVLHWVARTLELGRRAAALLQRHPAWVLLGLPLLLAPALASVSAPHPAPEGLLPTFWALGFYGAFYALGALIHAQPGWLARLAPLSTWLWCGIALAYLLFLRGLAAAPAAPTASWPMAALEALLATWLTLACLLAGRRWLDRPSAPMRYLSQASYTLYLVHLPLLFALQYGLMDLEWSAGTKLALSCAGTLAAGLLVYQLMVRHTPLARFIG